MSSSSPFPIKYVDRKDADYWKVPWHQIILIPKKDGNSLKDFNRRLTDLQSALEIQSLKDSIPHHSADGRKLTVELLKEDAASMISTADTEWLAGCIGFLIIHRPSKGSQLTKAMANLLESPRSAGGKKLLSVQHEGRPYSFEVELHPNNHMAGDAVILGFINPSDPAVVQLANQKGTLTFTDLYADKESMEWFAFHSIGQDLSRRFGIPPEEIKVKYEPLGDSTYPDFEMSLTGQGWAIEVARIESGMTYYVKVDKPMDQRGLNRALSNHITEARVEEVVHKEVNQKAQIRSKCPSYSRHCLLLVDIVDAVEAKNSPVWEGCDLSSFDVVAVVRMDGSVDYIKGQFALDSGP